MEPQSGAQQCIRSPFQEESSQSGQDLQVSGGSSASTGAMNGFTGVSQQQQTSSAARDSSAPKRCLAGSNASSAGGSIKDGFVLPGQVVANGVDSGAQQHAGDSNHREPSSAEKQQSLKGVKGVEEIAGASLVSNSHDHASTQPMLPAKDRTRDKSTSRNL